MSVSYFDGLGLVAPCSCICTSVMGLIIFGSSFCCSHTFRMSTRWLPVILFVSRIEYPFISCCLLRGVPVVAGGGFYFVCVISHVSNLRLVMVFCSSSSSCRLCGLSAYLNAHDYVTVYSVDRYGPDICYFHQ